ncbi:MAG TPA: beta galactosidase jelly roll domain-containing protein [Terriglobales bacterium]|nr:beta galactosidase jelly roll domain-containing protein [Terriglobales bacterium]
MRCHLSHVSFVASLLFIVFSCQAFSQPESPNLTELQSGWRVMSANNVRVDDSLVSQPAFDVSHWYTAQHVPATVLQVLQENGVYKNLYYGMNLATPGDLWKQDWWYRTTFIAPAGRETYSLIFKGINYRADIWLNGHKIANRSTVVGMYDEFEFNVTEFIVPGGSNHLAVKVTPEQTLEGDNGVELGDSWLDWINWKYLGYQDPQKHVDISFVPDRNAGVWKRVFLSSTGAVTIRNPYVATDLPLPATHPASLTVYCDLSNATTKPVSGTLSGEISRAGRPSIRFEKSVELLREQAKEIAFSPAEYAQLTVADPDLWWPYQWGEAKLYHLKLEFKIEKKAGEISDLQAIDFGIRKITQARDSDSTFPEIGEGGNFYLKVNGKDYLIRGGVYSPDLLFRNDPARDATIMHYAKDLGLNLLRWELKIADDSMIDRADREGMPVMLGFMCCAQWEHWGLWDAEDQWVARASLRARIRELRSHPSVVLWANGSDGLPVDAVLNDYLQILKEEHWQNAVVNTVSHVNRSWNGIHMAGPYVWRPPYYWFSDKYGPARGSSAEEGDNETIPPLESLRKFIPADKLWPINENWYFHAGANQGNNTLDNIQRVIDKRYGASQSAEEFSRKAQLAHYEDVRAQFETYATHWGNRKMMIHWMLNNPWPSLFGHLFDDYFKQGGGYYGAKKGLRPVNVVWDYYASGDRSKAKLHVVNQTSEVQNGLKVAVEFFNLDGVRKYFTEVGGLRVAPNTSMVAMTVPRIPNLDSTYLVRAALMNATDKVLVESVYWGSATDDDLGDSKNDEQFTTKLATWADMSALNTMPRSDLDVSRQLSEANGQEHVAITLANSGNHIAFFVRAEVTQGADGEEILPVTYNDNYITVFPHEVRTIEASFSQLRPGIPTPALRVEGYNVAKRVFSLP